MRSYIAESIAKHFCFRGCRIEWRKVRCENGAGDVHVKPEGVVGVALTAKGARGDTKPRDDGNDIKEPIAEQNIAHSTSRLITLENQDCFFLRFAEARLNTRDLNPTEAMNNEQFRNLLVQNSAKSPNDADKASPAPSGGGSGALGSRQRASIPMTP